jgi:hypothetical protein
VQLTRPSWGHARFVLILYPHSPGTGAGAPFVKSQVDRVDRGVAETMQGPGRSSDPSSPSSTSPLSRLSVQWRQLRTHLFMYREQEGVDVLDDDVLPTLRAQRSHPGWLVVDTADRRRFTVL